MSILSFFTGAAYNKELLTLKGFEADYVIETQTMSLTQKSTAPVEISMISDYHLSQKVQEKEILNTILLKDIEVTTTDTLLKNHVNELVVLNKILPSCSLARELNGTIKEIRNQEALLEDWKSAKRTSIPKLYETNWQRQGFILAFEKGLPHLSYAMSNNWQFLLMLPNIYHFNHYNGEKASKMADMTYKSNMINDLSIKYHMESVAIQTDENIIKLKVKSKLNDDLKSILLKLNEAGQQIKKYLFTIEADYEIDNVNGQVINACAIIREELNNAVYNRKAINLRLV